MWINSITLNNFRCFKSLPLTVSKDLNVLVGENNVGKTSVFIAVSKLISAIWKGDTQAFQTRDIRRSQLAANPLSVSCSFSLDANDRRDIIDLLSPKDFDLPTKRILSRRLGNILDTLQVGFEWSETSQDSYIKLGPLYVNENTFSQERHPSGQTLKVDVLIRSSVSPKYSESFDVAIRGAEVWEAANLKSRLLNILRPRFSHFEEFRGRPGRTGRTAALNSLEGSQTANVLLNLKNHTERRQRDRYTGVTHAFSTFFPQLRIEAVETEPSSGVADIHFTKVGDSYSVPIENVGAGVLELLTLLTNLVTLRGYIFVIEEPELHLHPHAKRNLADLIRRSCAKNQFFIITHDPLFIYPDFIRNLNRFYVRSKNIGTVVASMSSDLSTRDIGQIKTASKDISKRELYFARAVLFVEDESQQRFIEGCANKLDYNLDGAGLSVVEVGGQDGFEPYIKLAKQLDMPFLCLRDLSWGCDTDKPSRIFRSLGCELEQYLKQAGCGSLMEQARKVVGTSKRSVAKYCGEHIEKGNVPPFFSQLLESAMKLCEKQHKK